MLLTQPSLFKHAPARSVPVHRSARISVVTRFALGLLALCGIGLPAQAAPLTFEKDVRPILKAHCFHCHGEEGERKGKLDLRLKRLIAAGGESGPALKAGQPEESLLIERIVSGEMPPTDKKLPAKELAILKQWIQEGAATAAVEPENVDQVSDIDPSELDFWSLKEVRRPPVPNVAAADRVRNPIDNFLLEKLAAHGLSYAPEADRRTLIRRAKFDLLGLPPTPEETAEFVADERPDAYERLIDRLLALPQYGERWGRHWLDIAGYADSEGYSVEDPVRAHHWRYRDYVIRSLNADKPFDRFLVEQLAGDELVPPPYQNLTAEQQDLLTATGFLRQAPDGSASGVAPKESANAYMTETIKIVSTSLLGMTVGCAQCHNHRYDPITQADYYRMRALFEPSLDWKNWRNPNQRLINVTTAEIQQARAALEAEAAKIDAEVEVRIKDSVQQVLTKELAKLPEEKREAAKAAYETAADKRTDEQKALAKEYYTLFNLNRGTLELYDGQLALKIREHAKQAADVRAKKPPEEFLAALTEVPGQVPVTVLFHRGDIDQPKQEIAPNELTALQPFLTQPIAAKDPSLPTSGRRLAYAKNLTNGRHPLVGRVLVNRVWLHHFGRGIVSTPGDFGRLGDRPTHPELLDWLASEFVAQGWQLKSLHRLLMTSSAYRQSAQRSVQADQIDPDNKLLSHMSLRRLEAEAIRDAMLTAAGTLTLKSFGPPVPVAEDENGQIIIGQESIDGNGIAVPKTALNGEENRRSVYVQVRRSKLLSLLDTFDLPSMEPNCELRNVSTVTPQSLLLMNSSTIRALSNSLADRLERECGDDVALRARRAWELVYQRPPSEIEQQRAVEFLTAASGTGTPAAATVAATATPPAAVTTDADPKKTPEQIEAEKKAAEQKLAEAKARTRAGLVNLCQALFGSNEFLYVD